MRGDGEYIEFLPLVLCFYFIKIFFLVSLRFLGIVNGEDSSGLPSSTSNLHLKTCKPGYEDPSLVDNEFFKELMIFTTKVLRCELCFGVYRWNIKIVLYE